VEALFLLVFMSLVFVVSALGLFTWTVRLRSLEHADRLSLLPLDREPTDDR
jgi:hypothetical protein